LPLSAFSRIHKLSFLRDMVAILPAGPSRPDDRSTARLRVAPASTDCGLGDAVP
jgi:hypothetical protein